MKGATAEEKQAWLDKTTVRVAKRLAGELGWAGELPTGWQDLDDRISNVMEDWRVNQEQIVRGKIEWGGAKTLAFLKAVRWEIVAKIERHVAKYGEWTA